MLAAVRHNSSKLGSALTLLNISEPHTVPIR